MKTIFLNAQVFTGQLPLQEAFAVEDGRFTAVGSSADLLAQKGQDDQVVDLQGQFVAPGFIDSHMHLLNYGRAMEQCDLVTATQSLAQLQQALRQFIADQQIERDSWVLGRGWNQDYFTPATGLPTRWDLDKVTTEHPVCIVRCCGHSLVVNSRALEVLGIDETTPAPEGGSIERDKQGKLNGIFLDNAMPLVQSRLDIPTKADLKRVLKKAAHALNAVGITSCHSDDLCTCENIPWQLVVEAYQELEADGELTVRVYEQSQLTTPESLRDFLQSGYCTGTGSPMFKIGPLKILGDGSLGARTAFMSTGYADAPTEKGIAIFTQEQFDELISIAHENGMQVAVHAIGDGILDRILNAYEKAFARHPRDDHRSGIVHVQLTRPDQWERMQKLNLHAYIQSIFLDYDTHIVHDRAGDALASTSYAFHTLKQMGMHVSNGTDCPVEGPNPMRGIQCAVTRQPLDGSLPSYCPYEAMTVEEALQSYTSEGAHASFEEAFKGQIQPGYAADFAVLTQNPFDIPAKQLSSIRTLSTWLGGQKVYEA